MKRRNLRFSPEPIADKDQSQKGPIRETTEKIPQKINKRKRELLQVLNGGPVTALYGFSAEGTLISAAAVPLCEEHNRDDSCQMYNHKKTETFT